MNLEVHTDDDRKLFEYKVFAKRFLMSIKHVNDFQFTFRIDCPTMEEFIARDEDGRYKDETLNAMWWAWNAAKGIRVRA